jgi:outer membrane receptor protein involved in Fe transport
VVALVATAPFSPIARAQLAPASPTEPAARKPADPSTNGAVQPVAGEEDVLVLSPFEVRAEVDTGYAATETLAGTRIRTNLADVGGSIQVLTKQFLDDVGATDNQSLLQYTTNTQVSGPRGTYGGMGNGTSVSEQGNLTNPQNAQRVRGLAAADSARDYFITDIPWDSFNIDRIDILRGPNSILYGLGSPAGIINGSTRGAEFRNVGSVQGRISSYGSWRTSFDINREIIPGMLAIRLDGLQSNRGYQQEPAFENQKRIYGAVRFDPQIFKRRDFHTSIRAKIEAGDIEANRQRNVPPMDSVTPWFRPVEVTGSNPFGGMGKFTVGTVYDPTRTDGVVAGNGYGAGNNTTVNYQPWLTGAQVQQPFYFIDGATNRLDSAFAGYINNGWRNSTGAVQGIAAGNAGLRQFVPFYSVQSFTQAALNYNNWRPLQYFTDSKYGQYRAMSLLDPSVFDFYHQLIDGPNKRETQKWHAHNFDLQQTLFDDRIGINLSYDEQHIVTGNWSLLGYQPSISIDITKNGQDYYLNPSSTGVTNPNFGRPFVYGAGGAGGGVVTSDRKAVRASVFGEFRPVDVTSNQFLLKLLGKQRVNGVPPRIDIPLTGIPINCTATARPSRVSGTKTMARVFRLSTARRRR